MTLLSSHLEKQCQIPKMEFFAFLVSPPSVEGPLKSPSFVHRYVTRYLGNCLLLFSETWQLDRTWIGDKNVPSGSPLIPSKMMFSPLFFKFVHRNCLIFGTNVDNTYTLAILKIFGTFLIPFNPLNSL